MNIQYVSTAYVSKKFAFEKKSTCNTQVKQAEFKHVVPLIKSNIAPGRSIAQL